MVGNAQRWSFGLAALALLCSAACHKPGQCAVTRDCQSGFLCKNGKCAKPCTTDSECTGLCKDGVCVTGDVSLVSVPCEPACLAGELCNAGQCQCDPTSCQGCCSQQRCQAGTDAGLCGFGGSDCHACAADPLGAQCLNQKCGCVDDSQCAMSPAGQYCSRGACSCRDSNDCPVNQACDPTTKACSADCSGGGVCHGGCCDGHSCQPGLAAGACGFSGQCVICGFNPIGAQACVLGTCGCQSQGECTASAQGKQCLATGKCGCIDRSDCGALETCNDQNQCASQGCDTTHPCNGGCCAGGQCVSGTQDGSCGSNGAACSNCAQNGRACASQACSCTVPTEGADCEDNNPCTSDSCVGGACQNAPANAGVACQAALGVCRAASSCSGISSICPVGAVKPGACDDGLACTQDTCSTGGNCSHDTAPLETNVCRAPSGCRDASRCVSGVCTVGGAIVSCNDGDACDDADVCSTDGSCAHTTPPAVSCTAGVSCVTSETPTQCGQSGAACVSCDDGDACTTDGCAAGSCTHVSSGGSTAPTSISGAAPLCDSGTSTLTAMGGTLGTGASHQWGTGACGSNVIAGATGVSYTTPLLSATTAYWVRRSGGCGGTTSCATVTVTVTPTSACSPFACNVATGACYSACVNDASNAGCAAGKFCVGGTGCGNGTLSAPCDPSQGNQDCDPNLTCTTQAMCKLIAGQACSTASDCADSWNPGPQPYCGYGAFYPCSGPPNCCD